MTTPKSEKTTAVDVVDDKPFDEISNSESTSIIAGALGDLVQGLSAEELNKVLVAAEDLATEGVPHISKALLVGMPFVFRDIQIIEDGAVADESGEISDLVICAGQAVKVDGVGRVVDTGYVFTFTAGAEGSVLGSQMIEDAAAAKADGKSVFYRTGLTERKARRGTYYTTRATIEDKALDLFKK